MKDFLKKAAGTLLSPNFLGIIFLSLSFEAFAQNLPDSGGNEAPPPSPYLFQHDWSDRFWVSGQLNLVFQTHGGFDASYSGDNSLVNTREKALSSVASLYTGIRLSSNTDLILHIESAGGSGISDALGAAGYTNLDVVRNPTLGSKPYLARLEFRHIFRLSDGDVQADASPFSVLRKLPAKRLEVRFGKMSTADSFDTNPVGSDSHTQFLNWTIDNNGAYDYAADTRGYTYGVILDYESLTYAVHFGEMLMPTVANGLTLDWNLTRARAENIELEFHRGPAAARKGAIRLLTFLNHANMGSYRQAIDSFLAGREKTPVIENHRQQGRLKYGFGVNADQEIAHDLKVFARWGWNEGSNESFAYTEVNNSVSLGAGYSGSSWHRPGDKVGIALVSNGISGDHRRFLQLGGKGFLLGDGNLNYGREAIFEGFYNLQVARGTYLAADVQRLRNPGYNRDRGPVVVPGIRLHFEF